MTTSTCEVLAPICAGFIDGTQPDVCSVTPAPTEAVCIDSDRYCNGECFGRVVVIGCNGQANETFDCKGTCGGDYANNICGLSHMTMNDVYFGVCGGIHRSSIHLNIRIHSQPKKKNGPQEGGKSTGPHSSSANNSYAVLSLQKKK